MIIKGTGFGSGVNGHYVQPPSKVFDKSPELPSHVLAIRWPAPLLGKHIITEFILVLFVSIKAAMGLLSIAIFLQLKGAMSAGEHAL